MILKNREAQLTILAQVSQLVGGLIIIKLLSTSLEKTDFAAYSLLISVIAFVSAVPFNAVSQGYMRYVSIYTQENKFSTFYNATVITTLSILAIYFLISFFLKELLERNVFWVEHFYLIAVLICSEIYKTTYRAFENAARNRKDYSLSIFAEFFIKGLILFLVNRFWNEIAFETVIQVFAISNLVSLFILMRPSVLKTWSLSKQDYSKIMRRVLIFSTPLIIWGVFGWMRDMSGRWILDAYSSKEQVAAFALMASVAMIAPTAIQSVIGAYLVPILYEKENSQLGYTRSVLVKLIPFLLFCVFFTTPLIYWQRELIVLIISDQKYLADAWMLPVMFFAYAIFVVSMMSSYEIFAHKKTKLMLWPNLVSGLLTIVSGIFLTQLYGIEGMVIAFVISYLSYALIAFYISWKFKPL